MFFLSGRTRTDIGRTTDALLAGMLEAPSSLRQSVPSHTPLHPSRDSTSRLYQTKDGSYDSLPKDRPRNR